MAVKYVLTQRSNPQKPDEPKKWKSGDITLKEITQRCTFNYAALWRWKPKKSPIWVIDTYCYMP
jgi:hypothetical protein